MTLQDPESAPPARARGKPGPKTDAAKAAVVANAVTHGIMSNLPCIPGESPDEAAAFAADFIAALDVEGAAELAIARRAVGLLWRLQRIERFEAASISASIDAVEEDYAKASAWFDRPDTIEDAEEAIEDARRRVAILRDTLAGRPLVTIDGADADAIIELFDAGDVELPEHLVGFEGDSFASGGLLHAAASHIAETRGKSADDVLAAAAALADDTVTWAEAARADTEAALDRMRRQRLAPPQETLRALARYESTIDRAFQRTMNMLESMRSARHGAPIPLARLQVHV